MCERFLELAGVPCRIDSDVIVFIESYQHIGSVDAARPHVEHVIIGLSHLYPGGANLVQDVVFLHYLGMKQYATCDMLAHVPMKKHFDHLLADPLSGDDMVRALRALPVAPRLLEALSRSLMNWRDYYVAASQKLLGDYWVAVHVEHAREYGRVFRPEFLMACMYTATADWLTAHADVLKKLRDVGVAELVARAHEKGFSEIRALVGIVDDDEGWVRDLRWHTSDWVGTQEPGWEVDAATVLYPAWLEGDLERRLNESLCRVFV